MVTKLVDGTVLYHGSYCTVHEPDLAKCAKYKDFGQGFYLTTDIEQARSFAKISLRHAFDSGCVNADQKFGVVSSFVFNRNGEIPERLKNQYCFRTSESLRCLVFQKEERVWL